MSARSREAVSSGFGPIPVARISSARIDRSPEKVETMKRPSSLRGEKGPTSRSQDSRSERAAPGERKGRLGSAHSWPWKKSIIPVSSLDSSAQAARANAATPIFVVGPFSISGRPKTESFARIA